MASEAREKGVEKVIFKNVAITLFLILLLVIFGTYLYDIELNDTQQSVTKAISLVTHTTLEDSVNSTWFFILSIIGGVLVFYIMFIIVSLVYGGLLKKNLKEAKKMKKINNLKGHYIICGGGRVGSSVAEEFKKAKKEFVVVEKDPTKAAVLKNKKYLVLMENALEKESLESAGIKKARSILCCLNSDGNNLLLAILAREFNKNIEIVAKVDDVSLVERLENLGINKAILPAIIGGKKMAEEVLKYPPLP